MQLHRERSDQINIIRSMDDEHIIVGEQKFTVPCIVTVSEIVSWKPISAEQLSVSDFAAAIDQSPELILLGTGMSLVIPNPGLITAINDAGVGFEFMDNAAACRTYNVLAHEGRAVAVALLAG
ncbi:MAG: hypothetical protein KJO54_05340 [Gammaproteobacteria bacterium]|nr:hypothetical protein [Gammaproteobacteria bacterium]NNF59809.1 hypothetical protein [Gammaproteobacteria bacterium]NNM21317.1 hypothetical protein [Gammaproteobacteria bacterium]